MGIFRFTRQNHVSFSDDWKLFAGIFHNIGVFKYRDSVQTVFFDDNAQRILGTGKSLSRDAYATLLSRLREEPVAGEQDLYLFKTGAEKRYIRMLLTRKADEEIGFVEEITRRVAQLNADQQEYDDVTCMLRLPAFSHQVQRRMQNTSRIGIAAIHVAGLDKIADFVGSGSNYCMASVAEVLGRFASDRVLFTSKAFQDFYACFIDMDEQSVRMQLEQMRGAIAACTIADDFGSTIQSGKHNILDLHVGLAFSPDEGDTLSVLIPRAEFALFETQHNTQNAITRFSLEDFERRKDEYRTEQLYNTIIAENQLTYHFQPIVDAHTGEVVAYEALMRSEHFTPEQMLELAGRYGRLFEIEHATMWNAMRFLSEHQNAFSNRLLFINSIPTAQLSESDYQELRMTYEDLFEKVVFEIIEQSEGTADMLRLMRDRCASVGARIAIDDYGSGYANTATLINNMPHFVKIDRGLITDICRDTKKQQLVAAIIDYAHDNQIVVLGEGVEEEADMKTLIRMGVDLLQGFYTARPKPFLLEEISKEVRDIIVNTNLEVTTGKKKVYSAHNDEVLDLVDLALQHYTDIHIYRHKLTIVGDPEKTVPMHISVMENHSCELTFRNVNMICQEKPTISVGSYAQLRLIAEGKNSLHFSGIHVPLGAFFHLLGDGDLLIDCNTKLGYGIGANCDSSYGCITIDSNGSLEVICNSDRGIGIGGGSNPDDSEICLENGSVHISVNSPNSLGIGCVEGNALVYANPGCTIDLEVNGISSVGIGSVTGDISIKCSSPLNFSGAGNRVVGIGVLNKGNGDIYVTDTDMDFIVRTNFGACIGAMGGNVNVTTERCKISINAEGGEITGIGDVKGEGNVTLDHTELHAQMLAAKPHEAGSKNGQFSMRGSTIVADINEKHNKQEN